MEEFAIVVVEYVVELGKGACIQLLGPNFSACEMIVK